MRYCEKCGNCIDNDNAKFCRKCGASLPENEKSARDMTTPPPLGATPPPIPPSDGIPLVSQADNRSVPGSGYNSGLKKKSRAVMWLIIVLGIAVVSILATVFYKIKESSNNVGISVSDDELTYTDTVAYDEVYADSIVADTLAANVVFVDSFATQDEYNTNSGSDDDDDVSQKTANFLDSAIESLRDNLPSDMGDGMTLANVYVQDGYVTYRIDCDEDIIEMSLLDKQDVKSEIMESLKDKSNGEINYFIKLCTQAGYGVSYKYYGNRSGLGCSVYITHNELLNL